MNAIATTATVNLSTPNPQKPQQRQTAKEIIAANVKELIAQLEAGRSGALTAYLDAMSRFHNYSFGNVLEIARQRPNATRVSGLYAWNQLGRKVKKGEKGIRSFFRMVALHHPECVGTATRVLAIPMKRTDTRPLEYVSRPEIDAILNAIDRKQWCGRRDYALLLTIYNSGARVSELCALRTDQIGRGKNSYVHLHGKGRKERAIPLWPSTARILRDWLSENTGSIAFPGVRGEPLSRFAVRLLLQKAVAAASARCPSLERKRISPHTIRHGTAMALLDAGVDISVIALWLGHESIETTNGYLHTSIALKEKALAKVTPSGSAFKRFKPDDRLLAFLASL